LIVKILIHSIVLFFRSLSESVHTLVCRRSDGTQNCQMSCSFLSFNPTECIGNYTATSNNMKWYTGP